MRYISFYLPQYHPIPENDKWWGEGFTEWRNVVLAKPKYRGHYQPHIPNNLGFYDLRVSDTREKQFKIAEEYGISAFCFYHYWFDGKKVLEKPLEESIKNDSTDFPFCICWANENWTRAWDGQDHDVLLKQSFSDRDAINHARYLGTLLGNNRYLKVNGKPLIVIYRPDLIPNAKHYFENWKEIFKNEFNINDVYIVGVKSGLVKETGDEIIANGFDAVIDFQPNRDFFPVSFSISRIIIEFLRKICPDIIFQFLKRNAMFINKVNYADMVDHIIKSGTNSKLEYISWPTVFPSWDNTARRKTPTIIQNNSGEKFREWLEFASAQVEEYDDDEQIVFINAWNEWAEGCHLEPDFKNGFKFLSVVKEVVSMASHNGKEKVKACTVNKSKSNQSV